MSSRALPSRALPSRALLVSLAALAGLPLLFACGGKLAATDDPVDPVDPAPSEPPPAPTVTPAATAAKRCAPVPAANPDYGTLDVSQLGCECAAADCAPSQRCVEYAGIPAAHCTSATDPCDLLRCGWGASCIAASGSPTKVTCYR